MRSSPILLDPVINEPFRPRHTLTLTDVEEGLTVRYSRTRWYAVGESGDGVKYRDTLGRVYVGKHHAGSVSIAEFDVSCWLDGDDFLHEMDQLSQATYTLAEVICSRWEEPGEIFPYGAIVELRRAWMRRPFSDGRRLKAAIEALLELPHPQRALLVLKAFPLEYEGKEAQGERGRLRMRQKAMRRHYQHLFGVRPIGGKEGRDGWMYAIPKRLARVVPRPRAPRSGGATR